MQRRSARRASAYRRRPEAIIHRDLKPSNILVTLHDGVFVPKVIDFGIAKATQGRLIDATLFTAFEQFIGTPAYMSPEQAEMSGLDIDTRRDIYSLGVLLYELLTGRPPFDPKTLVRAGIDEILRIIREVDPPRPSTRLSDRDRTTIAKQRGLVPNQLCTLLRGDLLRPSRSLAEPPRPSSSRIYSVPPGAGKGSIRTIRGTQSILPKWADPREPSAADRAGGGSHGAIRNHAPFGPERARCSRFALCAARFS